MATLVTLDYVDPVENVSYDVKSHIRRGGDFLIGRAPDWGYVEYPRPDPFDLTSGHTLGQPTSQAEPMSFSGMAIGPGSDIDRVLVRYTLPVGVANSSGVTYLMQQVVALRVGKPIVGAILGPDILLYASSLVGSKALYPWNTYDLGVRYTDFYLPEGNFSDDYADFTTGKAQSGGVFKPPTLEIVLTTGKPLDPTWSGYRPHKRFSRTGTVTVEGTEEKVLVVPVFGRAKATVTCAPQHDLDSPPVTPNVWGVRVSGTYASTSGTGGLVDFRAYNRERQIAPAAYPTKTTFAAPGRAVFDLPLDRSCNFLIVYLTLEKQNNATYRNVDVTVVVHDE